jgi:hypothetical protein
MGSQRRFSLNADSQKRRVALFSGPEEQWWIRWLWEVLIANSNDICENTKNYRLERIMTMVYAVQNY